EVASLFARSFAVALTEAPAETSAGSPSRSFSEELSHEIVLARSTETPLTLVMICIRNFDEMVAGQDVATVNSALASQIRKALRSFDRLEEWGQGEFLISVPHTPTQGAEPVARKAEEALKSTPGSVAPEPRMGIVGFPADGREPEVLLGRMEEMWVRLRVRETSDILRAVENPPPAEIGIFSGDARTDSRNVQMLLETIAAVTSPGDMETLYERVLDQIIEMTGAERGILMLKGEDNNLEQAAARLAGKKPLTEEVLLSTSTIERVMETGDAVFVPDVLSEKDRRLISDSVQELNLRFIICAPLEVKDKRFGIVYLDSQIENQTFYRTNLTFFEAIVKQVSIAIENARLVEEKRLSDEQRRIALEEENIRLRQRLEGTMSIVGECPQMKAVFKTLEKTAVTDVTVLIYGESGTGKEAIASSIHQLSVRKARPFQIIDCGSIPENLLESELFGYRKGAFTGAYESRKDKFELANGGTIFLDEISNLPVALQMKLLRVLQERDIEPVGGGVRKKVDVRIIAATNQRLEELVERGSFRSDLYYRLNVLTIDLPPLRDRGDDILLLAKYFLSRFVREQGKEISGFSEAARRALLNHRWPGNVREVEHRVQRAVIMTDDPSITPQDLELEGTRTQARTLKEVREEAEMRHIWEVLDRTGGNVSEASRELGVSRGTLYDLLKKLKMRVPSEN
ncbi:MAG: sigma 54-interacting transcriptional regulator, partial [Planctomycetota bacterium]|nr:sigma 54-interacting transcriptional regulator [Planctomycetota bacterium]